MLLVAWPWLSPLRDVGWDWADNEVETSSPNLSKKTRFLEEKRSKKEKQEPRGALRLSPRQRTRPMVEMGLAKRPGLEPGDALLAPRMRTKWWGGPAWGHRPQTVVKRLLRRWQAGGVWRGCQRGVDTAMALVRLDSPSLESHKTQPDKP